MPPPRIFKRRKPEVPYSVVPHDHAPTNSQSPGDGANSLMDEWAVVYIEISNGNQDIVL